MKKFLPILFSLLLSVGIVFGLPMLMKGEETGLIEKKNEKSILKQEILNYSDKENTYYKLYNSGKLVGVIKDMDEINAAFDREYEKFKEDFPNTELGLKEDLYIAEEKSFMNFEDIDEQIIDYLIDNDLLGIKTTAIEFSTASGVYDIIYVKNIDDFYKARDEFILNFISKETLDKLRQNESIDDPVDFGTIEKNIQIQEKIAYEEAFANPEEIFTDFGEIFDYLCYGRNENRQYYTVPEGETLQGVGSHFGDMNPHQLIMLNRDILVSEDQILMPGTVLNVTYYTSPITVVVTKEKLTQEAITPAAPIYKEDDTLPVGSKEIIVDEVFGLNNILYEEKWINGVLQSGEAKSTYVVREPVQGVISLGTMPVVKTGTGNFIWPVDQPHISCGYGCYPGHTGTDIQSNYNRYGNIYAADSGVVIRNSYDSLSGNYVVIDHNNGYYTWYGHMNEPGYVTEGEAVERGQIIGQIGMTGLTTGPHVHFQMHYGAFSWSNIINVCSVMDCSSTY